MPNGSLERWLNSSQETNDGQDEPHILNLHQRINIAMDVAFAIEYLHYQGKKPIIHCDLKPSNILLDRDLVAHVGDFGLTKFLLPELSNVNQSNSIGIRGTVGYIAPQYGIGGEVSMNGDVYSYKILLLEMMIWRSPIDPMFNEGLNLHNFAKMALPNHVKEIVESKLLSNIEEKVKTATSNNNQSKGQSRNGNTKEYCLISIVKIGVACSMESPQDRMDLNQIFFPLLYRYWDINTRPRVPVLVIDGVEPLKADKGKGYPVQCGEYGLGEELSVKGDVYSYGILLLEMTTGRSPVEPMFNEGLNLHNFAKMALPDHVMEIVELKLLSNDEEEMETTTSDNMQKIGQTRNGNTKENCLMSMVKVGVACSMESPQDRMDLNHVIIELYSVKSILEGI
ncbi:hypothetical protein LguiB_014214 [Lonicera macranthoides]